MLAGLPIVAIPFLFVLPESKNTILKQQGSFLGYLTDRWLRALYLGVVFRQMGISGSFSLIFVYMASLAIPPSSMGVVSALTALAQVLGLILFGRLADQLGRKRIFLLGFGLSMFVALVFALVRTVWGMAIGHFVVGTSFAALYIASAAHIGDVIPAERHGVMLGLFDSTRALGGVLGPLVAGAIVPVLGFQGMFLTMAAVTAFGFLLVVLGTSGRRKPLP